MRTLMPVVLVLVLCVLATAVTAQVNVPLQKLRPGICAGFETVPQTTGAAVSFTFKKTGEERRLLAVEGTPASAPAGARAAEVTYELSLTSGQAPRPALIVFEKNGASWYRVGSAPVATGGGMARLSVGSLMPTAFSSGSAKAVDWGAVDRVWAGFVFDAAAAGKLTVTGIRLTDQAAVPTTPISLLGPESKWSSGQDPAISNVTLATVTGGPGNTPCMKYTFNVPGGRHMYAIPSSPVAVQDLEGYTALRFKYRAQIPAGMRMLITLTESNGPAYFCEPPAPYSAEWKEMTLPLSGFKWASWTPKDDNDQFDLAKLVSVSTGTHGTPAQAGEGWIMVCDLELVP